jgi:hypothetical protein
MLLGTAAVACITSLCLPFRPSVTFEYDRPSFYVAEGQRVSTSVISVTNTGWATVWYPGGNGKITNYKCEMFGENMPYRNNGRYSTGSRWAPLKRSEVAKIVIPDTPGQSGIAFLIKFSDWRGRIASVVSRRIEIPNPAIKTPE